MKINPIKCQPLLRKEPDAIPPAEQAKDWVYVFTGLKLKAPVGDLFVKS